LDILIDSDSAGADRRPETFQPNRFARKVPITFVKSACLSACIMAALTGNIFFKFDLQGLYEDLSRKSKFG
jgi:hypothetical protein